MVMSHMLRYANFQHRILGTSHPIKRCMLCEIFLLSKKFHISPGFFVVLDHSLVRCKSAALTFFSTESYALKVSCFDIFSLEIYHILFSDSMVKNRHGMRGPAARAKQGAKVHAYRARDPEKVKATIEKDLCESFQHTYRTWTDL
jgi:hypothetical protein